MKLFIQRTRLYTRTSIAPIVIGGMPAWVTKFRLHFDKPGLKAKDELAAVVLLDVGRPEAAILYISIPGTNREWDKIVDQTVDSIRPA